MTDTNLWIDLHCGGLVSFVLENVRDLCVTDIALHELKREPSGGSLVDSGLRILELDGPQVAELYSYVAAYPALSFEDLSALVAAKSTDAVLITGDRRLRKVAKDLNVPVHGTLWMLELLVTDHALPPGRTLAAVEAMIAKGSRLPPGSVAELKRRLSQG